MSESLNSAQRKAVQTLAGPLLVLAGAGSGKTRVVTFRIANLIRHGVPASRILAVTFTNKAAAEMQERIGAQLGKRLKERPAVSTFHAHCLKILRRHICRLGYPEKFVICDRGEQESIARKVLREIKVSNELLRPSDLLYFISRWKTASVRPAEAVASAASDKEHYAATAYRRYAKSLKLAGAVDFDDLLLLTEDLFQQFPDVRGQEAALFEHILIDEYQDTNNSQYRIIRGLAEHHRNLCVVGDDDQSIYGWRGAEVEHILRFRKDWPDANVVCLEENYRSTEAIIELANRLIAFNKVRHPKVLKSVKSGGETPRIEQCANEEAEAKFVVGDIWRKLRQPGYNPRDFAILFRTNEQPRTFETELRQANVPYVLIGGTSFFDRREVRDILAYLKVLETPRDEISVLRVINTPPRGISDKVVETILNRAVGAGRPIWEELNHAESLALVSEKAQNAISNFRQLVQLFQSKLTTNSLTDVVRELVHQVRYEDELRRIYPDVNEFQARWASVEQVINAVASYESSTNKPKLGEFLDQVSLGEPEFGNEKDRQLERNAVALMTLHSAKGLEFPFVYMVGLEEGILPHHRSLGEDERGVDEERRLCYVGITRARQTLTLSLSLTRMKWGKPRDSIPSRFLFEITGQAEKAPMYQKIVTGKSEGSVRQNEPLKNKQTQGQSANKRPVRKSASK